MPLPSVCTCAEASYTVQSGARYGAQRVRYVQYFPVFTYREQINIVNIRKLFVYKLLIVNNLI
jgi:hypothetical protein